MTTTRLPAPTSTCSRLVPRQRGSGAPTTRRRRSPLDAFVKPGGTTSADAYARWLGKGGGESETIRRVDQRARQPRPGPRRDEDGRFPPYDNLRADSIRAACDDSLRRLGTDRIGTSLLRAPGTTSRYDLARRPPGVRRSSCAPAACATSRRRTSPPPVAECAGPAGGERLGAVRRAAAASNPSSATSTEPSTPTSAPSAASASLPLRPRPRVPHRQVPRRRADRQPRGGCDPVRLRRARSGALPTLLDVADAHGVPMGRSRCAWLRTAPPSSPRSRAPRTVEQLVDLLRDGRRRPRRRRAVGAGRLRARVSRDGALLLRRARAESRASGTVIGRPACYRPSPACSGRPPHCWPALTLNVSCQMPVPLRSSVASRFHSRHTGACFAEGLRVGPERVERPPVLLDHALHALPVGVEAEQPSRVGHARTTEHLPPVMRSRVASGAARRSRTPPP